MPFECQGNMQIQRKSMFQEIFMVPMKDMI